uniref:Adaptor related protein complex 1 subunit mu 1 n=1 Tax=Spermophilus dauricus TaxID=99837 RepID=A0A8C9PC81_SPEDA
MSAVKAPVCPLPPRPQVLICRNYRGDVDMSEVEHFMPILMEKEEEGMLSPILAHGGVRFMWIKHNNLVRPLHPVVFSEYFKELEEESIRDNFVIIYELLDELMDFGYPQTTDSKILQEYITQEGHKLETGAPRPPATVTNAVSWRSEGIKYRKNEVFLDVIESVNLLVSANGNVLRSEIVGSIKMRVFLSGMPELRLGLNDKVLFDNTGRGKSKSVELEDVKFHQCVRLSRFENDRTISFIPPDGEFELMSYRLNTHVKPLIWIESVIEKHSHSRIEYMIKVSREPGRASGVPPTEGLPVALAHPWPRALASMRAGISWGCHLFCLSVGSAGGVARHRKETPPRAPLRWCHFLGGACGQAQGGSPERLPAR